MLCVRELLALDHFRGATVAAGEQGLDRVVEDIAIMEVPDIEDYVKKGDFLISTLYPIHSDKRKLEVFIPRLVSLGLSGLGVKLNRYVDRVPPACLEEADRLGFPVIVLPEGSNFSSQINTFLKESLHRKSMELEYRDGIHDKVMEIMLRGEEYEGLARALAMQTGKNVTLYSAAVEKLAEYRVEQDFDFEQQQVFDAVRLDQASSEEDYKRFFLEDGCAVFYKVHYGAEKAGYIVLSSRQRFTLTAMERMGVEQFAMAFRVMTQRQRALDELERRYREEFTCDLLFGKVESQQLAASRAKALEWKLTFPVSILLMDVQMPAQEGDRGSVLRALKNRALPAAARGRSPETLFLASTGKYIVAFLDAKAAENPERAMQVFGDVLASLHIGYAAGLSRPAENLRQLPRAYQESKDAMRIARQTGQDRALYFRDIGMYRVLHAAAGSRELTEFCRDTLGPLIRYDAQHNMELMATLDVILACNGNLKEAAKKMFLHYNTVRYRQHLIEEQLGKSLSCLDDYQDLNLAMKIYRLRKT